MPDNKLLTIGRIVAPHGVRGDVRLVPLTENPQRFFEMKSIRLREKGLLEIEAVRAHKNFILLKLRGINTMDEAETLRNQEVVLTKAELGPAPAGRYYVFDLLGLEVFDTQGNKLGILRDVITTGAADVYSVVNEQNKELLVPAIKSVIKEVDIAGKKLIIEPQIWEE